MPLFTLRTVMCQLWDTTFLIQFFLLEFFFFNFFLQKVLAKEKPLQYLMELC